MSGKTEILPARPHALFKVQDKNDENDWGLRCAVAYETDGKFYLYRRGKVGEIERETAAGKKTRVPVYQYQRTKDAGFKTAKEVVAWAQMMYVSNGQKAFD